jgi:hypothetical protein
VKGKLLILLILLLASMASATTIEEKSFREYGVRSYSVEGVEHSGCVEVQFMRSAEDLDPRNQHVLSLHADFSPLKRGPAVINILINGEPLMEKNADEFSTGWARFSLPKEMLQELNQLEVCMHTTQSITKIEVLEDSIIGIYRMADFSHEDSLEKVVNTGNPTVNRPFTVTIVARNYGAGDANVFIDYRIVAMPRVELIEGETRFQGVIPAYNFDTNQPGMASFNYKLFPKEEIRMTLPRATLTYTDIFGDAITVKSTQPDLYVERIDKPVEGLFVLENAFNAVGEEVEVKLVFKNNLGDEVQNIAVYIEGSEGLEVDKKVDVVTSLEGQASTQIELKVKAEEAGAYALKCDIVFRDENIESIPCPEEVIYFEQEKADVLLLAGAALAAVALLIYLFIYLKK